MRLLGRAQQLLQTGRIISTNRLAKRQLLVELGVSKSYSLDLSHLKDIIKNCAVFCVVLASSRNALDLSKSQVTFHEHVHEFTGSVS